MKYFHKFFLHPFSPIKPTTNGRAIRKIQGPSWLSTRSPIMRTEKIAIGNFKFRTYYSEGCTFVKSSAKAKIIMTFREYFIKRQQIQMKRKATILS